MIAQIPQLYPAMPEIFILVMACVVLLVGLFTKNKESNLTYILAQLTLIGAVILTFRLYSEPKLLTFHGSFILDPLSSVLKLFIYLTTFTAFLYSRSYIRSRNISNNEYYVLGLFATLGMMVMVSSHSFLVLYLGLELLSLPLYALIAIRREVSITSEAAMKYFVMGSIASGMLLYGFSMLYGATGTLDITTIAQVTAGFSAENNLILAFGLVFVVVGLAFKLGAAPFHMWVPDVYQGSPTSVTIFLSSGPKIAVLGILIRILIEALPSMHMQWQQLLIMVAILSIGLGNVVAIAQSNIKRMLAYSSIAHAGYMLLGVLSASPSGYASSVFYMITYSLMSIGAFGMVVLMSKMGFEAEKIEDFKGLNARSPWLAFMFLIIMFSMAGLPPTVGFFAKVGVFEALIGSNLIWLAAVALLFSIIGAFYYIRIVKVMYFDNADEVALINIPKDMQLAISINGLLLLLLGLFPSSLIRVCHQLFGLI